MHGRHAMAWHGWSAWLCVAKRSQPSVRRIRRTPAREHPSPRSPSATGRCGCVLHCDSVKILSSEPPVGSAMTRCASCVAKEIVERASGSSTCVGGDLPTRRASSALRSRPGPSPEGGCDQNVRNRAFPPSQS